MNGFASVSLIVYPWVKSEEKLQQMKDKNYAGAPRLVKVECNPKKSMPGD
jgi:hypothetical protein